MLQFGPIGGIGVEQNNSHRLRSLDAQDDEFGIGLLFNGREVNLKIIAVHSRFTAIYVR